MQKLDQTSDQGLHCLPFHLHVLYCISLFGHKSDNYGVGWQDDCFRPSVFAAFDKVSSTCYLQKSLFLTLNS